MVDRFVQLTKDGTVGSGVQTSTFDLDTSLSPLGDANATYVIEVNLSIQFGSIVDGYTQGGRWGGCFTRMGGLLLTPKYALQKVFVVSDASTLTWSKLGDNQSLRFTLDVFYNVTYTKWYRAWMTIYGKDNTI